MHIYTVLHGQTAITQKNQEVNANDIQSSRTDIPHIFSLHL